MPSPHVGMRAAQLNRQAAAVKRIYVDFSVFTPKRAEGFVHGIMELPFVPGEGETLSFETPRADTPPLAVAGFTPKLVVEHVLTDKGCGPDDAALSLCDVNVATGPDAEQIFAYFEHGFGLDVDRHQGQRNAQLHRPNTSLERTRDR